MNLPNKLTISRIILTFVFMVFLFSRGIWAKSFALLAFIIASLTDYYDGLMARKRSQITNFGKLMDPIADKILTLAAFLAFVELRLIPAWMVVAIVAREMIITGLRLFAATKGKVMAAEVAGKHKTASQVFAIFTILGFLVVKEVISERLGLWNSIWEVWFLRAVFCMMLVVVLLTLISGVSYLKRNRGILLEVDR